MVKRIVSLFIILSLIIALNPITMNKSNAATKPLNILFIGNSKTYYNNMPAMLSNMLTKSGKKNNFKVLVKGGMSLNFHYKYICKNKKIIKKLFNGNKIDYVIFNEQTDVQVTPFDMWNDSYDALTNTDVYSDKHVYGNLNKDSQAILDKLLEYKMITKTGTTVILNATWDYFYMNSDQENDELMMDAELDFSNSNFRKTCQSIKNIGYKKCYIAYSGNAINSVYKKMFKARKEKAKLAADKRHTTPLGSYIEALALYKAMFRKNMNVNYGGSITKKEMKKSYNNYVQIKNFQYEGQDVYNGKYAKFLYTNIQDYKKKAFNKTEIKNVHKNYIKIRNIVNSTKTYE